MNPAGSSNTKTIKAILEIKKENEKLEELISYLKMENFEYALKCNHMENILSNMNALVKDSPAKMVEATDNICKMLQMRGSSEVKEKSTAVNRSEHKQASPKQKQPTCSKAHIVKPHMVNGHILYVPTINLTRVSNLHSKTNTEDSSQEDESNSSQKTCYDSGAINFTATQSSASGLVDGSIEMDSTANTLTEDEGHSEDQITQVENVNESSISSPKSPSHSTVLSGTFQEVKIYLNPMSSEDLNEESGKMIARSRRSAKVSGSSGKGRRTSSSFGSITKRRRN